MKYDEFHIIVVTVCSWYMFLTKICLSEGNAMEKFVCNVCGYMYDPEEGDPSNGIDPGTPFDIVLEDWSCLLCGVGKDEFAVNE